VSDHFVAISSDPHSGHFTFPGKFGIIMAWPPLLNDVGVDDDLSFDQSDWKYMVDQIVFVFIDLERKHHSSGRKRNDRRILAVDRIMDLDLLTWPKAL
jgi:hypothetical protein